MRLVQSFIAQREPISPELAESGVRTKTNQAERQVQQTGRSLLPFSSKEAFLDEDDEADLVIPRNSPGEGKGEWVDRLTGSLHHGKAARKNIEPVWGETLDEATIPHRLCVAQPPARRGSLATTLPCHHHSIRAATWMG